MTGHTGRHAVAPATELVVYAAHAVQVDAEAAPVAAENVPTGHCSWGRGRGESRQACVASLCSACVSRCYYVNSPLPKVKRHNHFFCMEECAGCAGSVDPPACKTPGPLCCTARLDKTPRSCWWTTQRGSSLQSTCPLHTAGRCWYHLCCRTRVNMVRSPDRHPTRTAPWRRVSMPLGCPQHSTVQRDTGSVRVRKWSGGGGGGSDGC
jgi:hypothetical protein